MSTRGTAFLGLLLSASGCVSAADHKLRENAEQVVMRALRAEDASERLRATRLAASVADPTLDRSLPPRLADTDARVRAAAAVALASQSPIALEALRAAIRGSDPASRLIAFDGFALLDGQLELLRALIADPDAQVRARAAVELGGWKPSGSSAWLFTEQSLRALATDADAGVRAAAVRACASVGKRGLAPVIDAALADAALPVRLAALAALARLDTNVERFTLLASSQDTFLTLRAAVQLRRLGREAPAVSAVRAALADRRPEVRAAALNAAGELGAAGAELALPLLRDPDLEVRLAAARALAHTDRASVALPVLLSALGTTYDLDAADELARLGDARGRAHLQKVFDHDAQRRNTALSMLAPLPGSTPLLERALQDADGRVRLTAAETVLRRFYR
jgi:HEAT repeat protein